MDVKRLLVLTSPISYIVKNRNIELFDDEDEECTNQEVNFILQRFHTIERSSVQNFYEEVVPLYSDVEFIRFFRISKELFQDLAERYKKSEVFENIASQSLVTAADKSLAIFLWFCANECESYREISNLFDIAPSTVHAIIRRIISFLSSLAPAVITWPTIQDMKEEAEYHFSKYGLPGVIGAVDGTHIRVDPPLGKKDDYIDRKGNVTLGVQAVCNHNHKFLHASIGYPGSVHDARIFRCSNLPNDLESTPSGFRILGDSAYPCMDKVLTPFRDNGHLTSAQKHFNYTLSSSRVMIEHTFGILKQRFRQLYYCKLKGQQTMCHFIRTCLVLHNLSKDEEMELMTEGNLDSSSDDDLPQQGANEESVDSGKSIRDKICADLFAAKNHRRIN